MVVLHPCNEQDDNQFWMLSKDGEIRRDEICVDYAGEHIMAFPCHGSKGNQEWRYNHQTGRVLHAISQKCMGMTRDGMRLSMERVKLQICSNGGNSRSTARRRRRSTALLYRNSAFAIVHTWT
ncbi:hypothetical protein Y032_0023g775 [Ancylostoma ceylanicum]|nr:hypothetical protein Y032_0023g775 [Ancylostoma ceylanicum]